MMTRQPCQHTRSGVLLDGIANHSSFVAGGGMLSHREDFALGELMRNYCAFWLHT